jgi:hypothetical protein
MPTHAVRRDSRGWFVVLPVVSKFQAAKWCNKWITETADGGCRCVGSFRVPWLALFENFGGHPAPGHGMFRMRKCSRS